MKKKLGSTVPIDVENTVEEAAVENTDPDEQYGADLVIGADFDLKTEFKPSPLIPKGTYHGGSTRVTANSEDQSIDWTFTLRDNGGVMSDGETPIDGQSLTYRNWLPKPGDEELTTKDGRMSKRQAKINMMAQFAEALNIDMSTPVTIMSAIANQEWLGMDVDLKVRLREFQGRVFNDIERVIGLK